MKKQKKPELTLYDLSNQMAESIEGLARTTKSGFDDVQSSISRLEVGQKSLETGQKVTQKDIESINLRLGYLAPQFEVEDLKKRVTKLERKTGIFHASRA